MKNDNKRCPSSKCSDPFRFVFGKLTSNNLKAKMLLSLTEDHNCEVDFSPSTVGTPDGTDSMNSPLQPQAIR